MMLNRIQVRAWQWVQYGLVTAFALAGFTQEVLAQNDWAARSALGQGVEFEPGVVWIRFAGGQSPPAGWDPSGPGDLGTFGDSFQVTGVRQAFPQLEAFAHKRPLTATMVWLQGVYEVAFSGQAAPQNVAQVLARGPDIELAEPQPMYRIQSETAPVLVAPDDVRYAVYQAYLGRMQLEEAWDVVKGESGSVVIATVDIALEISHEDHASNLWTNAGEIAGNGIDDDGNGYVDDIHGWNFTRNRADPSPENISEDHGTRVAGAANASTNNSVGVAGAAWNAKTMGIQAMCRNSELICYSTEGIIYAYINGADIINASFGVYDHYSTVQHAAIKSAFEAGALVVAAAGNDTNNNDDKKHYPSDLPEVLGVGATRATSDVIASFSNYGRSVPIFAPGIDIETTDVNGTYASVRGTSYAAPLVAGVAALLKTLRNDWGPGRIREHLRLTADNIDGANRSDLAGLLGSGRVNAHRAVTASEKPGVRLESTVFTDANGNLAYEPGEEITVSATFTNHGGSGSNISIGFTSIDRYIRWNTSSHHAGALRHGDSFTGDYTFTVQPGVPATHELRLVTSISEGDFRDSPDFVDVSFISIARSATHTTPSIQVSFLDSGNIGHLEHAGSSHDPGIGFQVLQPGGTWEDYLYEGGLVVGRGPSQVMSSVRGSNGGYEQDFAPAAGSYPQIVDPGQVGSQDGSVTLVGSSTSSAGLNLKISQQSYTYDAAANDDYIVLHYTLTNTGQSDLNGLYTGLYLDWNVGSNVYSNDAGFDVSRSVGYVTESGSSNRFVGARLLSAGANLSYTALDNDLEPVGGDFTDAEKWALLSGGIGTTTRSSVAASQFIAAGPIDLSVNGSEEVVFALVSGQSLSSMLQNADAAYREWNGVTLALSTIPVSISEGAGPTTVTVTATSLVTLNNAAVLPISVTGSGTPGKVEFADVPDFSLTIPMGETSASTTFTLTPTDDQLDQSDEWITISNSSSHVTQSATLTLIDDDATPSILLSVHPTTIAEGDGATSVTVTGAVTGGTMFGTAQAIPLTVAGSGTNGVVGFTPVTGVSLPIGVGVTRGTTTFTLTPSDNQVAEANETVTISSSSALVTRSATLTLTDDDATPSIVLSVEPDTVSEGDGATTITVTGRVTGAGTFGAAQFIALSVAGSGDSGAVRFAPVQGLVVVIWARTTSGKTTFTLTPTDNLTDDAHETITISSSHALVSNAVALMLLDDDGAPPIRLSATPGSVDEGGGSTTITVTANSTDAFSETQVLPITVTGSGAPEAVDFTAVSGFDLSLPAGDLTASGSFTLVPTDDVVDEVQDSLWITSTNPTVVNSALVLLTDDDQAPDGVTLSITPSVVSENDGATSIVVTATVSGSTRFASDKVLNLSVAGSGLPNPVDFVAVPDFSLTIPAEAASGTGGFVLSPENDQEGESDETITIRSDSAFVLTDAVLVLRDDDGGITHADPSDEILPLRVAPPFPNPAVGQVTFVVSMPAPAERASLRLYNTLGQQVAVPFEGALGAGEHTMRFDGQRLPAGVYMYVFKSPDARITGYLVMAQ